MLCAHQIRPAYIGLESASHHHQRNLRNQVNWTLSAAGRNQSLAARSRSGDCLGGEQPHIRGPHLHFSPSDFWLLTSLHTFPTLVYLSLLQGILGTKTQTKRHLQWDSLASSIRFMHDQCSTNTCRITNLCQRLQWAGESSPTPALHGPELGFLKGHIHGVVPIKG